MGQRGRKKGIAKPPGSGRQKGTPNKLPTKRAVSETVAETFARLDFDPLEELVKLIPTLPPESQAKTLLAVLPYVHAQVKAPETPAQPAFQVFANVDKAALLRAVNAPELPAKETLE